MSRDGSWNHIPSRASCHLNADIKPSVQLAWRHCIIKLADAVWAFFFINLSCRENQGLYLKQACVLISCFQLVYIWSFFKPACFRMCFHFNLQLILFAWNVLLPPLDEFSIIYISTSVQFASHAILTTATEILFLLVVNSNHVYFAVFSITVKLPSVKLDTSCSVLHWKPYWLIPFELYNSNNL